MSKLKSFTLSTPRPLPVIILADISGSMSVDGKINALNTALRDMIMSFQSTEELQAEVHISVITFGGRAMHHVRLQAAGEITWYDTSAMGGTPMGEAFKLALEMIADRSIISSRAYTPTMVLLTDGQPTDAWEEPLADLLSDERANKAFRLALAIGDDADEQVLRAFLDDQESPILRATDARNIRNFIRLVTMSVQARSRSAHPNTNPELEWDL